MSEAKKEDEKPIRERVLGDAIKCVTQDRNKAYGSPEDNFTHIANLWNAQFEDRRGEFKFTSLDVAVCFCLMKIARIRTSPEKADNYVDLAGYAGCAADCAIKPPTIKLAPKLAEDPWKGFQFKYISYPYIPEPKNIWKAGLSEGEGYHMEHGLQGDRNE